MASVKDVDCAIYLLTNIFDTCANRPDCMKDVLLISIDTEYNLEKRLIRQIGISTLDTSRMSYVDLDNIGSIAPLVSNRCYLLDSAVISRTAVQYRYGDPIPAVGVPLNEILLPVLNPVEHSQQARNVVLVGHSIECDIDILRRCGFDFNSVPNVRAIIDTAPLASRYFGSASRKLSLKRVCQSLQVRRCGFHNAAHDALYTLQALLITVSLHTQERQRLTAWNSTTTQKQRKKKLFWNYQSEILDFVGRHMGDVLWTGSPKQRRKKQIREDFEEQKSNRSSISEDAEY